MSRDFEKNIAQNAGAGVVQIALRRIAQRIGIFKFENLFNLPIDKICGAWYNGNFGARWRKALQCAPTSR